MATETLRPNAAGDEETLHYVYGDGVGTHYTTVDEAVADDDTTYVYDGYADWYRDLYNLPTHSVGSGTINFIKVYVRCKAFSTPTQSSAKTAIKSGTTVAEGSEISPTVGSYTTYSYQWSTNPATGVAFTWAEIDALQIGIAIRRPVAGYTTRCTQVYVEVDYTAVVAFKGSRGFIIG